MENLTKQQKNCPYCRGTKRIRDLLVHYTSRRILEIQEGNVLSFTMCLPGGKTYTVIQNISFCPMCGRRLGGRLSDGN